MPERRVPVEHATVKRWVITDSPQLEEAFQRRQRPVWVSWRLDETYRLCRKFAFSGVL
jgi:transposase-like protein